MAEDGNGFNCENGSSKNQTSTSEKKRRASKEASRVWVPLKRRRGNPEAARMLLSQRVQPRNWSPSLYTCQMCPIVMQAGADTGIFKGGGGTVNKSYKKVGVDPQKGVGAGGGYAPSRAKRGSF